MAQNTRSGLIGNRVIRTPVASLIAFAIAPAGGTIGGSPTPRTPYGPSSAGISRITVDRRDQTQAALQGSVPGRDRARGVRNLFFNRPDPGLSTGGCVRFVFLVETGEGVLFTI